MPRPPRADQVGCEYHIMNRGAARRTVFERPADFRFFMSRLAKAVRRGEIQVLAFSLLMTHYHLLVRSLGGLSEALRRAQNEYVRYFNRTRRRDGPLFRGRFTSRAIFTHGYFCNVFRYIDENAVQARVADRPEEWPWGSAARFFSGHRPQWLCPDGQVRIGASYGHGRGLACASTRQARAALVQARLRSSASGEDPLDALMLGGHERVLDWMMRKAQLADGTQPGYPLAGAEQVLQALADAQRRGLSLSVLLPGHRVLDGWLLMKVGLLRDLAGLPYAAIGSRVERSGSHTKCIYGLHQQAVPGASDYREIAAAVASEVLAPLSWTATHRTHEP